MHPMPEIIWGVLALLAIGLSAAFHGNRVDVTVNFWRTLLLVLLETLLVWWGGFFG